MWDQDYCPNIIEISENLTPKLDNKNQPTPFILPASGGL